MRYSVGVIGNGYVGSSISTGFAHKADIYVYDVNPNLATHTLEEVVKESDFIFVAVPTPMDLETGKFDSSILEEVFEEVQSLKTVKDIVYIVFI